MKRLKVLGLFLFVNLFFGCNRKGGNEVTATNDTTANHSNAQQQEMLQANREVQRAIETGDSLTLRKYITADAVDHGGGPNGADVKGDELMSTLNSAHSGINNLKFETLEEAATDDHVFSLVRMTGTTNKPIWGMPANFKIDSRSIDLLKMKDGKITDHWNFMEPAEMMKMMNPEGKPANRSHK